MGLIPSVGARLARATFEPDLMLSDGEATFVAGRLGGRYRPTGPAEAWIPFRAVFDILAAGRRHVMMGPSQIDRFGNANISAIGDFAPAARQLIGMRGAPGNTVNHPTSYWLSATCRAPSCRTSTWSVGSATTVRRRRGRGDRFHDLRRVVTNLAVLDFCPLITRCGSCLCIPVSRRRGPRGTGFDLAFNGDVPTTRKPTHESCR